MLSIIATPFGYIMRFIYELVGNYGLSIFLFALLAKLIMLPLNIKSKRSMIDMQRIQPKMLELQKKYARTGKNTPKRCRSFMTTRGFRCRPAACHSSSSCPSCSAFTMSSAAADLFHAAEADEINAIAETLNYTMSATDYTAQIGLAGVMHQHFDQIAGISDKIMQVDFNFLGINLAATPSFGDFNALWVIPILSALTPFCPALFRSG